MGYEEGMGRRRGRLKLILSALEYASKPMTSDDVREAIFHQHFLKSDRKDRDLEKAWRRWMILQLRQSQRLAMEGLLAWVERRNICNRDQSLEPMVERIQHHSNGAAKPI